MAATLKRLGFRVIEGLDLDKAAFERKVRDFSGALRNAEVGLFFYAGHGVQVAGQNYLLPVDAKAEAADALDWEMVRLDLVQRTMERATATNIIFLDACRNNPLTRNLARAMGTRSTEIGRGLAAVESGVGTLISFSTQPGNVALDGSGRNSPFTTALLKHMPTEGDDLSTILINVRRDVMAATDRRQVPWEHTALTARVFLAENVSSVSEAERSPDGNGSGAAAASPKLAVPSQRGSFDGRWNISWSAPRCRQTRGSFSMVVSGTSISGHGNGHIAPSGSVQWIARASGGNALTDWTGTFRSNSGSGQFVRRDGKCVGSFTARRR